MRLYTHTAVPVVRSRAREAHEGADVKDCEEEVVPQPSDPTTPRLFQGPSLCECEEVQQIDGPYPVAPNVERLIVEVEQRATGQ